jgi:hypothetical protein
MSSFDPPLSCATAAVLDVSTSAAEVAVRAAQIGARAWMHLEHLDHAEHLLTLARTVIETVDDTNTRQRLRLMLATDSPVSSVPIHG